MLRFFGLEQISSRPLAGHRVAVEALESRQLLSAAVGTVLSGSFVSNGNTPTTVDLSSAFTDPAVALVEFTTNLGNIDLQLTPRATPKTVANFLAYVNDGLYNNTVVHRSAPGFVIQGGGFTPDGNFIQTFPPIVNEFSPSRPNVTGTIAMAKTSNPNSATSQWFINLANNSSSLDNPANSGGFTVFGSVISGTMSTVNTIANLPITDGTSVNSATAGSAWAQLPVLQQVPPGSLTPTNYVIVNSAMQVPDSTLFTYSVTSDNPSLVSPSMSGTGLTLSYPTPGATGAANITVTATDAADGSTSRQTFVAAVGALPVTLSAGGAKSVSFVNSAGKVVQISYAGPGSATVTFTGTGLTSTVDAKHKTATVAGTAIGVANVSTTGTSVRSTLTFGGVRGASLGLGSLTTNAAIGAIAGAEATLTGQLAAGGAIGKLTLGPVTGGTITLAGTTAKGAITLGAVTNSTITSTGTIASLSVKGNVIGTSITLTGTAAGKANDLGKFVVSGTISSSTLTSAGNLGLISAAATSGSAFYAGVSLARGAALPSTRAEFTSQSSIASVKINNVTGTDLSAFKLGNVTLGLVHVSNGGVKFGFVAASVAALTGRTDAGAKFNLRKLTTEAALTSQLAKEKLTLTGTDLLISII